MISTKPTSTPTPKILPPSPSLCLLPSIDQLSPGSSLLRELQLFLQQIQSQGRTQIRESATKEKNRLTEVTSLFALLAQNKCTSLVCSCYAPTRHSTSSNSNNDKSNESKSNRDQLPCSQPNSVNEANLPKVKISTICSSSSNGGHQCNARSGPSSIQAAPGLPLKSNLKKTTSSQEDKQANGGRKVSWPDAYGKDLAHVQEFQPSVSEEGELEGVRNSCVCVIQ